jgi:hypothetical protein
MDILALFNRLCLGMAGITEICAFADEKPFVRRCMWFVTGETTFPRIHYDMGKNHFFPLFLVTAVTEFVAVK